MACLSPFLLILDSQLGIYVCLSMMVVKSFRILDVHLAGPSWHLQLQVLFYLLSFEKVRTRLGVCLALRPLQEARVPCR